MIPYIIMTPGDNTRKEHILNQLKEQEIDKHNMVPAIMHHSQPCVGIMRSFKQCIKWAQREGMKECCILEDDCLFLCKGAWKRFLELNTWITEHTEDNRPCDIFLTNIYDGTPVPLNYFTARVDGKLSGLTCSIIKSKFYDTLLQAEEPYNLDTWISEIAHANIYCAYPFLVLEKGGYSYNAQNVTNHNHLIETRYKLINCDELNNRI